MEILIKNIDLLSMDGKKEIEKNMNIFLKDGVIKDIYQGDKNYNVEKIIEGKDKLVMPGLINAHTHLGMSILRNYADDLPLHEWLTEAIWPIEAKLTEDDIYWSSLLSMLEMVESGTTTFSDMYFFMDKVADGLEVVKMRGVLARGMGEEDDEKLNQEKFDEVRKLYKAYNNKFDGRIKVMVGPHAPYTCGKTFLKDSISLAKELNTGIHIHLSETEKEVEESYEKHGMSPIEYAKELGMFDVHTLAAHCTHLSDKDIEILRDEGVYPVNNPGSNLKLAGGFARVKDMLDAKIPVSLGTDGSSSNNNLNMFEEINLAALINKAINKDATAVSAYEALEMATINGAKALGLEDEIGSIVVGKKADLIIIDLDKTHLYPRHNLISSLAYSAQASDVDTVIINGDIIMENRKFNNIDVDKIIDEVEKIQQRLIKN